MERAAAVVLGGIGLVLLTLAAVAVVGPDPSSSGGGVDLAVFATTAPPTGATVLGTTVGAQAPSPPPASPVTPSTTPGPTAAAPTTAAVAAPTSSPPPAALPPELVEAVRQVSDGGVRFEVGRSELDANAVTGLDRLAARLRERPDVVVVVRGHTDSTGGEDVNRPLSQRRAQAVIDFLVCRGVGPGQLRAEGVGPDQPVADNDTVAGRQANRRSEVSVEAGH